MNYTEQQALDISVSVCQQLLAITEQQNLTQHQKNIQLAMIMNELEQLGIPLLLDDALQWCLGSIGNQIIFNTYQKVSDMRKF